MLVPHFCPLTLLDLNLSLEDWLHFSQILFGRAPTCLRLGIQIPGHNFFTTLWPSNAVSHRQHLWQNERLVGSPQPEQLQTSGRHHEVALAADNANIPSDLGGTTIATLFPSSEAFLLLFSALFFLFSHEKRPQRALVHESTHTKRAPTPNAHPHQTRTHTKRAPTPPTTQRIRDFVTPTPNTNQRNAAQGKMNGKSGEGGSPLPPTQDSRAGHRTPRSHIWALPTATTTTAGTTHVRCTWGFSYAPWITIA